ncbi:MAG: ImmA/IrrE family metallo-endopeptidase [Blautia sp.]|nr:ImmA/IrrE family metallo-endopeptidase [Blautia sp.]
MFEKNLKYFRLKKKMSKKDLAEMCGITPMAISNYESGKRVPDMETINKLAAALGVYVADFLDSRNDQLVFSHCEFRKKSKLTKTEQEFVRESVEEYFSRFFDAIECLGGNPLPEPVKCHDLDLSSDYQKNASELRRYLKLSSSGPVDELTAVLENLGILIFEIEMDNDSFAGMNGTVNGYPYIVINKNIRPERKRTTIIHELSHIMFNWSGISDEDQEKMSTAIAGAFLISNDDLFRELGPRKSKLTKDLILVCEEYGISMYLLVLRANQVGIMNDGLTREFYIKANKANWREKEPSRVKEPEKPMLFKQLVYRAINEEGISIQKGAEFLGIPTSEMNEYCGLMEVL